MLIYGGEGLINSIINKLPVELHIPGYSFCGPGTKLAKRLSLGQRGVNPLDSYCREHDIAYSQNKTVAKRHEADKALEEGAWERFKSQDASIGEKTAALAVNAAMKIKRKLGAGMSGGGGKKKSKKSSKKKCKVSFKGGYLNKIKKSIKSDGGGGGGGKEAIKHALEAARMVVKRVGGKKKIKLPRMIPIPKEGGILPLIPIFAGLSALGALAGGTANIAKAISDAKDAKKQIQEGTRHNKAMEAIAKGKKGTALYLKPYRQGGAALYLKPYKGSKN